MLDLLLQAQHMLSMYHTSSTLTVAYNAGAAAGTMYGIQVASGVVAAMHYTACDSISFSIVDSILYGLHVRSMDSTIGVRCTATLIA